MRGSQVTSGQESGEEGLGIPGLLVALCNPGADAQLCLSPHAQCPAVRPPQLPAGVVQMHKG